MYFIVYCMNIIYTSILKYQETGINKDESLEQ